MNKTHFEKLKDVIKDLRHPTEGCPWDLKQTHESLLKHLVEETYEFAEAVELKDPKKMEEELGDVLLQVMLHSQLASEKNLFDVESVSRVLREKLIRRHPHVFENKNVNVEIVRTGFANYYFYSGKDFYSDYLEDAWDECLEAGVNLCERLENVCASCLVLSSDSLKNNCGFTCDLNGWEVKGEGRDKIIFSDVLASGEETKFDLDLSSSGGSLFLRDDDGGLVVYVGG